LKGAVLLIGGHGVLGRPVARRLAQEGFAVRALARRPEKARALLPPSLTVLPGDLENPASIEAALEGCGAVYVSVDTRPGDRFRPETDGLRNVVRAARRRNASPRLLVLSVLGGSLPDAARHPWRHLREKHEAQIIAKTAGLPWTIFEPTWFMESLPLFTSGKNFFRLPLPPPHWIAGDDYGRMIAAALSKNLGVNEMVPVQGPERLTMAAAGRRFIQAYDKNIRSWPLPAVLLRAAGLINKDAKELADLLSFGGRHGEPAPDPRVWERFGKPALSVEGYAGYVRATGDFPRKR